MNTCKHLFLLLAAALAGMALESCSREADTPSRHARGLDREITFSASEWTAPMTVETRGQTMQAIACNSPEPALRVTGWAETIPPTKAFTEVTQLSSFHVMATIGSNVNSAAKKWVKVFTDDGTNTYKANMGWPDPYTQPYHFYASNANMDVDASGRPFLYLDTGSDIVGAFVATPSYKTKAALQFHHLLARFGDMIVTAAEGYSITGIQIKVIPKVTGNYLFHGSLEQLTDGTETFLYNKNTTGIQSNDLPVIPAAYNLKVSWTASRFGKTEVYEDVLASLPPLEAGKKSSFRLELGGHILPALKVESASSTRLWFVRYGSDLSHKKFFYSYDGENWTACQTVASGILPAEYAITVPAGGAVYLGGNNADGTGMQSGSNCRIIFDSGANVKLSGNIMSLMSKETDLKQMPPYGFYSLFSGNAATIDASGLELPATILDQYCYMSMFQGCPNLTQTPKCLPATTLRYACYSHMFAECGKIQEGPQLPATSLAQTCYSYMFSQCSRLTTAPDLPATSLENGCYDYMFQQCSKLKTIKCMAVNVYYGAMRDWVSGVSSSGTFVKNTNSTGWITGTSGIPSGWTVLSETP